MQAETGSAAGSKSASPVPTTPVILRQLTADDILLGRGALAIGNEGNVRFRSIVRQRKQEYKATNHRGTKDIIARQIIQAVRNCKGRFVRRLDSLDERAQYGIADADDAWVVADDDVMLQKVKQSLRDKDPEPRPGFHILPQQLISSPTRNTLSKSETVVDAAYSPIYPGKLPSSGDDPDESRQASKKQRILTFGEHRQGHRDQASKLNQLPPRTAMTHARAAEDHVRNSAVRHRDVTALVAARDVDHAAALPDAASQRQQQLLALLQREQVLAARRWPSTLLLGQASNESRMAALRGQSAILHHPTGLAVAAPGIADLFQQRDTDRTAVRSLEHLLHQGDGGVRRGPELRDCLLGADNNSNASYSAADAFRLQFSNVIAQQRLEQLRQARYSAAEDTHAADLAAWMQAHQQQNHVNTGLAMNQFRSGGGGATSSLNDALLEEQNARLLSAFRDGSSSVASLFLNQNHRGGHATDLQQQLLHEDRPRPQSYGDEQQRLASDIEIELLRRRLLPVRWQLPSNNSAAILAELAASSLGGGSGFTNANSSSNLGRARVQPPATRPANVRTPHPQQQRRPRDFSPDASG